MIAASLDEIMDVLTGVTVTVTLPGKREKKKKTLSQDRKCHYRIIQSVFDDIAKFRQVQTQKEKQFHQHSFSVNSPASQVHPPPPGGSRTENLLKMRV